MYETDYIANKQMQLFTFLSVATYSTAIILAFYGDFIVLWFHVLTLFVPVGEIKNLLFLKITSRV